MNPSSEFVLLVDDENRALGIAEKLYAHQQGLCHRAFSVFVLREIKNDVEILLQRRAAHKYHSPSLWTNTCCSHPRPQEAMISAAKRRLAEELGLMIELSEIGRFHYIAHFENGLIENEMDHVLLGWWAGEKILPNAEEVMDTRWINLEALSAELAATPQNFTPWLQKALLILRQHGLQSKRQ